MTIAEVTLILTGASLFVTLIFAVFTLWKNLRKKKEKETNGYYELIINDLSKISFKKVKPQILIKPYRKKKYPWPKPTEREDCDAMLCNARNASAAKAWSAKNRRLVLPSFELPNPGLACDFCPQTYSEVFSLNNNLLRKNDSQGNNGKYNLTDSLQSNSDQSRSNISNTGAHDRNSVYLHEINKENAINHKINQTHLLERKKIGTITIKAKLLRSSNNLEVWISRVMYFNNEKQNMNFFVLLCIMPENTQLQTSKCVNGSSEFNFNEKFIFHHIDVTQLNRCILEIKLIKYNKIKKFQNEVIGEAFIPSTDLSYSIEDSEIYCDLLSTLSSKLLREL
ncbi:uncharacterized protein LOC105845191 isoform X1 [Hydra vulgaris]|uniref:uncharacterized protein LOC105845191 isoform X1 n=1 Tax=Hydra vulgaris TaxID=6087 RepID=UPI001F5EC17B|nr:uncharacterized protein LOC105845191 isoform X1 [Hydra vulgaris]